MVERRMLCFDVKQIAQSGQCFRMYELEPGHYSVTAFGQYLEIWQQPVETQRGLVEHLVQFGCSEEAFQQLWAHYFDLETDYASLIGRIGKRDHYLQQAAAYGSGIRILNQELWEVMVTFLISQNNHIKRIQGCVERLCSRLGEQKISETGHVFYTMPGPQVLASNPQALSELGLGYRDKYIARLAEDVTAGKINLEQLRQMKQPKKVHDALTQIYGIGDKVADCIQLFGLHHIDAFPVDTWIRRILEQHYPKGFPLRRYRGCAGVMQQYMFYYEVSRKNRQGE